MSSCHSASNLPQTTCMIILNFLSATRKGSEMKDCPHQTALKSSLALAILILRLGTLNPACRRTTAAPAQTCPFTICSSIMHLRAKPVCCKQDKLHLLARAPKKKLLYSQLKRFTKVRAKGSSSTASASYACNMAGSCRVV